MTKKKIFAYIISIASVLSLASCGDIDVNIPTSQPASDKVAEVTTIKEDNTQNNVAETQITEAAVNQETDYFCYYCNRNSGKTGRSINS